MDASFIGGCREAAAKSPIAANPISSVDPVILDVSPLEDHGVKDAEMTKVAGVSIEICTWVGPC